MRWCEHPGHRADRGHHSLAYPGLWAWVPPNVPDGRLGISTYQTQAKALQARIPHRGYHPCHGPSASQSSWSACGENGSQGERLFYDHHKERNHYRCGEKLLSENPATRWLWIHLRVYAGVRRSFLLWLKPRGPLTTFLWTRTNV